MLTTVLVLGLIAFGLLVADVNGVVGCFHVFVVLYPIVMLPWLCA